MSPSPNTKPSPISQARLIEQIKGLARSGYGVDDIQVLLEIKDMQRDVIREFAFEAVAEMGK